jgi:hypothetical protein
MIQEVLLQGMFRGACGDSGVTTYRNVLESDYRYFVQKPHCAGGSAKDHVMRYRFAPEVPEGWVLL